MEEWDSLFLDAICLESEIRSHFKKSICSSSIGDEYEKRITQISFKWTDAEELNLSAGESRKYMYISLFFEQKVLTKYKIIT